MSRLIVRFIIPVIAVLLTGPSFVTPAKAEVAGCKAARSFVTGVSTKVAGIMSKSSGHKRNFLRLFKRTADLKSMADFALGRYARSMPGKKKAEYYKLAEKTVVSLFSARIGRTKGRRYRIWNCKPKGRGFTVNGVVVEKNGDIIIDLHWLLMPRGRSLKILDVSVAHLWLTQQQRTDFRKVLSKNGGDFSALFKYMRAQAS